MQVAGSQELMLIMGASVFLVFMLGMIFLTLSGMKRRRKEINDRMKDLEKEYEQYKLQNLG
jgi:preprotein translocase subunit YajC